MSTIIPQSELMQRAVRYVSENLAEGKELQALLQDACMRFNLSPKDSQLLCNFFKDHGAA